MDYDLLNQITNLTDFTNYFIMFGLPVVIVLAIVGHFLKIKWFKHTTFFLLVVVLFILIAITFYIAIRINDIYI